MATIDEIHVLSAGGTPGSEADRVRLVGRCSPAFVRHVGNEPNEVRKHFDGLREAITDLPGIADFDRSSGLCRRIVR